MFLAHKKIFCLTFYEKDILEEHKTLTRFNDINRPLNPSQQYKKIEGKKISAMLSEIWKKSFNSGVIIPAKMRSCNEGNDKTIQ